MHLTKLIIIILTMFCLSLSLTAQAQWTRGIYLTQSSLENTSKIKYLIKQAKAVGINTFVIDLKRYSHRYARNIKLVKSHNIKYVARIVIFPSGGTSQQVRSKAYWNKKYSLINHAINLGASEIQLDYIRYKASRGSSRKNATEIHNVIKYYKQKTAARGVLLQIDVFGEALHFPSRSIGQDIRLFANSIDVLCPMTYPSHYEPYRKHAKQPYQTVHRSLQAMTRQMRGQIPFKVIPYIELYNYRYAMSRAQKIKYIHAQIKAIENHSHTHGWYAWSPHNRYEALFAVLRSYKLR